MTPTNEDLLTLADRLDGIEIYSVRENRSILGTRPIEAANNAVCEAAAALRAIVAERQKPQHGKEVMPNDEDNSHERPAVSPRLTAGAQAVRVKPLVWVETFEDRGDGLSEHNGGYESASVLGFYEIGMGFGSDAYYWSVCDPNYNEIGSFEDPSYAKSAAQADYEARILAALDVSETPESDRQTDLLSATERQVIRDKALDDAAQCCEAEADKCDDAVKWGGAPKYIANCKAAAYAMRDRAYTIRAMKGKPE